MSILAQHGKAALIAPALVVGWMIFQFFLHQQIREEVKVITIGVEHTVPGSIMLSSSIGSDEQIIDVTNESNETIGISLPEDWKRDEVRNTSLADLTSDPPVLGYRRWHLPTKASVTFRTFNQWRIVKLENPSKIPLNVKVQSVRLSDGRVEKDAYLMKDEPLTLHF